MTIFPFAPSSSVPFTFQPTLDGVTHTAVISWNVFGERWYLNLYTLQGSRVCTVAVVGSPNDADINLVGGYFTTSVLVYRADLQQFEVTP
jgi:hypothetical protein